MNIYVAVEGLDGSGKTTQVEALERKMLANGRTVKRVKEPTEVGYGKCLRHLAAHQMRLPLEAEITTFIEDRKLLMVTDVRPAYQDKKLTILSDRCFLSNLAYQGARAVRVQIERESMFQAEPIVEDGVFSPYAMMRAQREFMVFPDLIFYLQLPAHMAENRIAARKAKATAFEDPEYLARVGFLYNAYVHYFFEPVDELYPGLKRARDFDFGRCLFEIDASQPASVITEKMWDVVSTLERKNRDA
jgi:dTMP kinase